MDGGMKRAVPVMLALCLLFGMSMPVYGTEKKEGNTGRSTGSSAENGPENGRDAADMGDAGQTQSPKVVISDIYHRHIGRPDVFGGCYTLGTEHKHIGSEDTEGGCYTKPIYHSHQGNEETGGGCYGKEVKHGHQGNPAEGGGCYNIPVKHEHNDGCYEERPCTISYTTVKVIGTETGRCFSGGHGETTFVKAEGIGSHDSCDAGAVDMIINYCQACGFMAPMMHDYPMEICGKDGVIESYKIGCGKEDGQVERYERDCGYEDRQIERYETGCGMNPGDIEGYRLDCGLQEDKPCGQLVVTNETAGRAEQVTLKVKVEDFTGGKLVLADDPFTWQDKSGNQVGKGGEIQVKENGDYAVTVKLENKDVDESGLHSIISVDNVYKAVQSPTPSEVPRPSKTPEPSQTPGDAPSPSHRPSETPDTTPSGNGGNTSDDEPSQKETSQDDTPQDDTSQEETPVAENNRTPSKVKEKQDKDREASNAGGETTGKTVGKARKKAEVKASESPTPSNTPSPKVEKETKEKVLPKKQAMEEVQYKVKQAEKSGNIFANPVVRMVTVTAGFLILLAGILLWLLYLRNSVKVYNDDGEGRMIYLGRGVVGCEEDVYILKITEKMVEKSYTNRYCIKPGLFGLGRNDEELVVYKEAKNVTVLISKEIIAVL